MKIQQTQITRRRPFQLATIAVVSGLILGACSSSNAPSGSSSHTSTIGVQATSAQLAQIRATYSKTISAKSAQIDAQVSLGSGTSIQATGPFEMQQGTGQLDLNLGNTQIARALKNPTTLMYYNNTIYLEASGIITSFDQNKPWAQLTHSAISQLFCLLIPGSSVGVSSALTSVNPIDFLEIFSTPDLSAREISVPVGQPKNLAYYNVSIDIPEAITNSTGVQRQILELLKSGSTGRLKATVGINSDGATQYLSTAFISGGTQVGVVLGLSSFGLAVNVQPPQANQVGQLNVPGGCLSQSAG